MASSGTLRAADDWNLFAVAEASDTCAVEWSLFAGQDDAALLDEPPPPDEVQAWQMFAIAEPDDGATLFLGRFNGPCVVLLTGTNCPPCEVAKSVLKPLLDEHCWPVTEISFANEPGVFEQLGVDAVPTFVAVRRGVECGRYSGTKKRALCSMLRNANSVELK